MAGFDGDATVGGAGGLRTDHRRALDLLAEGDTWLGARDGEDRRAWVQMSKYRGDEIPTGWDVFEHLLAVGWVAPGRRLPNGRGRLYRLTDAGRTALAAAGPP